MAFFITSSVNIFFPRKQVVDCLIPKEPTVINNVGYTSNAAIIPFFSGPKYLAVITDTETVKKITSTLENPTYIKSLRKLLIFYFIIAGTPTANLPDGTSLKTTAFAPIVAPSFIVRPPIIFAPAKILTLFFITG